MSTIERTITAQANADAAARALVFDGYRNGSAPVTAWLPTSFVGITCKPVTMGLHRSRRLRRPSP